MPVESSDVERSPVLVNETLVKTAGWVDAIGQIIKLPAYDREVEVIGVIGDFHFASLYEEIKPFTLDYFYNDYRWQRHLMVDFDPAQLSAVLAHAEAVMRDFAPDSPFQYSFLADTLQNPYRDEQRQMQLVMAGAVVCVLVSLLGVFGMTAFTLDQAGKEIAIRRILGGTMTRIIAAKFRGLFGLIIAAGLCAFVLVFHALGTWLEQFAYRVPLDPGFLLYATLLVLALTGITIALQSAKLVHTRPVHALRYE